MADEQPKKMKASIEFEIVEGAGIDADSFLFTLDGKLIGCMDNFELRVNKDEKIGMLYFTQNRIVPGTGVHEFTGTMLKEEHKSDD
jgi:hypothetical protein